MSEAPKILEKSPNDPGFFPDDLSHRPRPLIFLVGLAVGEKDVHKRIHEAFTVHRSTKRPITNYQLVTATHEYPVRSKQRLNYENYIPVGIIPTSWIQKHLHKLPSVLALFYDLDWDAQDYDQKQTEVCSRVSCLRHSLQGLNTRILLVLIQSRMFHASHSGSPVDQLTAKRMTALAQACGIQVEQMFHLPYTERMMDCILKIEISFMEQAMLYYTQRIKTVRAHKDLLSKPLHLSLFVRHQFKIGFFSEFKKEMPVALKHYNHAYNYLLEIQVDNRNALEVKMVAGILNYKICQLTFVDNPRQAISNFKKHIEIFRKHEGPRSLSFQHQHWLAAENSHFARMFSDALDGIQTLNPGMYYVIASKHAKTRKDTSNKLPTVNSNSITLYKPPNPRFYGQYAWRDGVPENEESDDTMRNAGVAYLCEQERNVEHNWEVIGLLCRAVNQFKRYSSRRLTASIKVQLAEEYFSAGEYKKILDLLLGTVSLLFRGEHWWSLLERVGELCLCCAYLEKSYPFFVMILIESLSHYSPTDSTTKLQLQDSLEKFLRYQPPNSPDKCPPHLRESTHMEWSNMCEARELSHVKLDMNQLAGCIECKVLFDRDNFQADQIVILHVYVFSSSSRVLPLKNISIHLSREYYSECCTLSPSQDGESFMLYPYSIFSHTFTFLPHTHDVGSSIHADSIHIEIGYSGNEHPVTLTWSLPPVSWGQPSIRPPLEFSKKWNRLLNNCSTDIILREPKIGLYIQTPSPSLVGDLHKLTLILENKEESDISNVSFKLELLKPSEDTPIVTSLAQDLSICGNRLESLTDFTFKQDIITAGEVATRSVSVKSKSASIQEFHLLVSYDIYCDLGEHGSIQCSCIKECRSSINIVYPFKIIPYLTTMRYLPLELSVRSEEPFLLHLETTSTCPWPLKITDSCLKQSPSLEIAQLNDSQIQGCAIEHEESLSEIFCMQVPDGQPANSKFSIGDYVIKWKRIAYDDNEEFNETTMTYNLPRVVVKDIPFIIKPVHPSFGKIYEPLDYRYVIFNKTLFVQEFEVGIDDSPDFLFSGIKAQSFNVLPRSEHTISYCLCPTFSGNLKLPRFWIRFLRDIGPYEGVANSMIPTHLFIKP
ncbi:Trafficking protein particle complex subunit 11-like [Oopsacas minuta]|uniref:Trafficking protein particle complex subunit 11-like n=1 Tax=Oopsacas minuta TaxID=111878 RepID=A0AAV7JI73_9METZ|nr:Trafficking protein particle complex subunit 11-like [Oopsacas minuta]